VEEEVEEEVEAKEEAKEEDGGRWICRRGHSNDLSAARCTVCRLKRPEDVGEQEKEKDGGMGVEVTFSRPDIGKTDDDDESARLGAVGREERSNRGKEKKKRKEKKVSFSKKEVARIIYRNDGSLSRGLEREVEVEEEEEELWGVEFGDVGDRLASRWTCGKSMGAHRLEFSKNSRFLGSVILDEDEVIKRRGGSRGSSQIFPFLILRGRGIKVKVRRQKLSYPSVFGESRGGGGGGGEGGSAFRERERRIGIGGEHRALLTISSSLGFLGGSPESASTLATVKKVGTKWRKLDEKLVAKEDHLLDISTSMDHWLSVSKVSCDIRKATKELLHQRWIDGVYLSEEQQQLVDLWTCYYHLELRRLLRRAQSGEGGGGEEEDEEEEGKRKRKRKGGMMMRMWGDRREDFERALDEGDLSILVYWGGVIYCHSFSWIKCHQNLEALSVLREALEKVEKWSGALESVLLSPRGKDLPKREKSFYRTFSRSIRFSLENYETLLRSLT